MNIGTSLVVQWLRFHVPSASGDPALIPGQGARSHMLQLRPDTVKKKKKKEKKLNFKNSCPVHFTKLFGGLNYM